jgi:hypothetical protein
VCITSDYVVAVDGRRRVKANGLHRFLFGFVDIATGHELLNAEGTFSRSHRPQTPLSLWRNHEYATKNSVI